jgi:hypothetical protein
MGNYASFNFEEKRQTHTSPVPVFDGNQHLAHTTATTMGKALNASQIRYVGS